MYAMALMQYMICYENDTCIYLYALYMYIFHTLMIKLDIMPSKWWLWVSDLLAEQINCKLYVHVCTLSQGLLN